ncbi:hypothetical protein CVT24_005128 [Panaeolus cyanescens]|uniref:Alpha/beta hydrolase fold-3 domain-containing protein n=1 Tax=Panaeolus cyanescens TaxID=181874 RepID=A0A409V9P2_9AGAR|nr:hypothetical protein CVT24_005128 [Panaeolus cyanescens]
MAQSYAFRHQPWKGLYLTYQLIVSVCVRFPLWVLFNLPSSWRPLPTWSLKRAIMVNVVRRFMETTAQTGNFLPVPNHLSIGSGRNVNGVWVAAANHLVTGELKQWADIAGVSCVRIPGYWYQKKGASIKPTAPAQAGEKIFCAFHGGAYIKLSAHPKDPTAAIARGLLQRVDNINRLFSLEYRLAVSKPFKPAHPFPTQLLDALSGYNYLVNTLGFAPENIIVVGDSAGANLAHALVRYLTDYHGSSEVDVPAPPGGLILLSPWADLGKSHEILPNGAAQKAVPTDYIGSRYGDHEYAKDAFTGPHGRGAAEINPYISPASLHPSLQVNFTKFPRTFIIGGGAEIIIDSIRTLKERMVRDLGEGNGVREGEGKVRYLEAPDAVHDYLIFTWHEPERTQALKAINEWVNAS